MKTTLSAEQTMLRENVQRYLAHEYNFAKRHAMRSAGEVALRARWREFAELGWIAAALPESKGGLAESAMEMSIIAESLGSALTLEPYVPAAVLCQSVIVAIADTNLRDTLLGQVQAGEVIALLADGGDTLAEYVGQDWQLNGSSQRMLSGSFANMFLVVASISEGLALFRVESAAAGLRQVQYRTLDARGMSDLHFDGLTLPAEARIALDRPLPDVLAEARDRALVALCAEMLGAMDRAFTMTRDYLQIRQQFGRPLADFQALQHKLADMFIELEQARSMVLAGVTALDEGDPALRARMASAAKQKAGRAARRIGAEAIQLHGGIGMSEEYEVGHLFKRLLVAEKMFGDTQHHLQHFQELERA